MKDAHTNLLRTNSDENTRRGGTPMNPTLADSPRLGPLFEGATVTSS